MGNSLGNLSTINGSTISTLVEPPPLQRFKSDQDPNFGFPNGRKPRVMKATEAEMISARLPHRYRDYCAHDLINYKACRKHNFPFVLKCHHEKHLYEQCQYDDYVLRFMETERSRRLKEREERIAKKRAKEELE
uniref:NADH dehydrogenase [ubiquinone] 1 beta subcomplex subunit 7 n=1 Tax=Ornithodoros turicata TaxID=34597 RepID=A0A2R5LGC3_9ACAR